MRIASLLPSLTELICALGRGDDLVGVTHECDYPARVKRLPHVTHSRIPDNSSSREIDTLVAEQGGSLYRLDADALAALRPELILTQEQCDVCAVNEATVRRTAAALPGSPQVESVNPTDLAGVFAMFRRVGTLLGAADAAEALIARFEATSRLIAARLGERPRPSTVLLEWLDPPFTSGHWNPELINLAGGRELLAKPGERSRRIDWEELRLADPEVVILAPCGCTLDRGDVELAPLLARPEWKALRAARSGQVVLVDGSAYFAPPGPRLEDSLRIAATALAPDVCDDLAPLQGWRRVSAMEGKKPTH